MGSCGSPGATGPCLARVFVRVIFSRPYQGTVYTFTNHCLEGKSTFGDPFHDSGVVRTLRSGVSDESGIGTMFFFDSGEGRVRG